MELRRQAIAQERSEGSVQTMNRLFGMPGLTLGVVRIARGTDPATLRAGTL